MGVHPASPDNEERRLRAEYQTATRYYSWAVSELRRTLGYEDYGKLFQLAEEAFGACEKTRLALRDFEERYKNT